MRLSEITARTVHQMSFSETNAMTTHTEDRDRLRPFFELDHVDPAKIPISEIKRLQDLGIDNDSLSLALTHQARQRLQGVKINTLDQILGLSPPDAANNRSLKNRLHETCADQILHSVDLKMRRNETYLKRRKRGEPHITGVPVWAYSIEENGEEQAAFTERLSSEERRLILKIGNETWMRGRELAGERRKGRILNRTETLIAAFTDAPQRVLGYLATFQMKAQGQCYPSHEWIAKKTGKSRRGVQMALKVLQGLGFIDWLNRFKNNDDPAKPPREQTSNIYRCRIPQWLRHLFNIEQQPLPDDEKARHEANNETLVQMLLSATPAERVQMLPSDPVSRTQLVTAAIRMDNRAKVNHPNNPLRERSTCAPPGIIQ